MAVNNFGTERGGVGAGGLAARLARNRITVQSRTAPSEASTQPETRNVEEQMNWSTQQSPSPVPLRGNGFGNRDSAMQQLYGSQGAPQPRNVPGTQRPYRQVRYDSPKETSPGQPGSNFRAQGTREGRPPQSYGQQQGPRSQGGQVQRGPPNQRVQITPRSQDRPPAQRPRDGQPRGPRTPRQQTTPAATNGGPPARATRPARAPLPVQRRRADNGAHSDEIPPGKINALGHLPAKIEIDSPSVKTLFAARGASSARGRTFGFRITRRRLQKPLAISKGKLLSSRTKAFRQRSVGDYSRYRPAQVKASPHISAVKPSVLAYAALSHNRFASLRGRRKALGAIKQALAVGNPTEAGKVARL